MTQILFISQADFKEKWNINPPDNSVCISIVDPTSAKKPKINDKWQKSLRLEFYDYDTEDDSGFGKKEAKEICEFVDQISQMQLDYIIVHCYAGISRSAAVAKFISIICNLRFPEHYILHNKYIFTTLLKYWNYNYIYQEGSNVEINNNPGSSEIG